MGPTGVSHKHDLRAIGQQAMIERGLLPSFSAAVLGQVRRIEGAAAGAGPEVRDLRDLLWASIDNDDSRDLDQLSVAEPLPNGAVKVLVAITDVDAVVTVDSAIDGHARHNATSVYTAAEIFPMLPERLSTDLTSLNEGQERLAIVKEDAIEGPPDLVVEVLSPSTFYKDLRKKMTAYSQFGVQEYWIVDPETETIEIHARREDKLELARKFSSGESLESALLPGLRLAVSDVF